MNFYLLILAMVALALAAPLSAPEDFSLQSTWEVRSRYSE